MGRTRTERPCFSLKAVLFIACLHLLGAGSAAAFDVQIHGYGNQDFIMSNKTDYFGAEEGTWNHNSMSLVFTGNVTDDTAVWAKVFAESEETSMEWLYVNKKFGNGFDARAGQMKMPLGFFNLIRDNKFLHLAETEPALYSESIDMVQENFRGVGLEYNNDWTTIEVFGGAPEVDEEETSESFSEWTGAILTNTTIEKEFRGLYGGRLKLKTPVEGLSFMISASTFEEEEETTTEVIDTTPNPTTTTVETEEFEENLWIASMQYEHHGLELTAEYGRKSGGDESLVSYYGEVGYTFFEKLTPYVRYDFIRNTAGEKSDPEFYQEDTTVGIGYKINDYVKIKAENHFIKGWALAVERGDVNPTDPELKERWNMFVAGVNFMF